MTEAGAAVHALADGAHLLTSTTHPMMDDVYLPSLAAQVGTLRALRSGLLLIHVPALEAWHILKPGSETPLAIANDGASVPSEIKATWRVRSAPGEPLKSSDLTVTRLVADVPENLAALPPAAKTNCILAIVGRAFQASVELMDRFAANAVWRDVTGDVSLQLQRSSASSKNTKTSGRHGSIRRRGSGLKFYDYHTIIFSSSKQLYHLYNGALRRASELAAAGGEAFMRLLGVLAEALAEAHDDFIAFASDLPLAIYLLSEMPAPLDMIDSDEAQRVKALLSTIYDTSQTLGRLLEVCASETRVPFLAGARDALHVSQETRNHSQTSLDMLARVKPFDSSLKEKYPNLFTHNILAHLRHVDFVVQCKIGRHRGALKSKLKQGQSFVAIFCNDVVFFTEQANDKNELKCLLPPIAPNQMSIKAKRGSFEIQLGIANKTYDLECSSANDARDICLRIAGEITALSKSSSPTKSHGPVSVNGSSSDLGVTSLTRETVLTPLDKVVVVCNELAETTNGAGIVVSKKTIAQLASQPVPRLVKKKQGERLRQLVALCLDPSGGSAAGALRSASRKHQNKLEARAAELRAELATCERQLHTVQKVLDGRSLMPADVLIQAAHQLRVVTGKASVVQTLPSRAKSVSQPPLDPNYAAKEAEGKVGVLSDEASTPKPGVAAVPSGKKRKGKAERTPPATASRDAACASDSQSERSTATAAGVAETGPGVPATGPAAGKAATGAGTAAAAGVAVSSSSGTTSDTTPSASMASRSTPSSAAALAAACVSSLKAINGTAPPAGPDALLSLNLPPPPPVSPPAVAVAENTTQQQSAPLPVETASQQRAALPVETAPQGAAAVPVETGRRRSPPPVRRRSRIPSLKRNPSDSRDSSSKAGASNSERAPASDGAIGPPPHSTVALPAAALTPALASPPASVAPATSRAPPLDVLAQAEMLSALPPPPPLLDLQSVEVPSERDTPSVFSEGLPAPDAALFSVATVSAAQLEPSDSVHAKEMAHHAGAPADYERRLSNTRKTPSRNVSNRSQGTAASVDFSGVPAGDGDAAAGTRNPSRERRRMASLKGSDFCMSTDSDWGGDLDYDPTESDYEDSDDYEEENEHDNETGYLDVSGSQAAEGSTNGPLQPRLEPGISVIEAGADAYSAAGNGSGGYHSQDEDEEDDSDDDEEDEDEEEAGQGQEDGGQESYYVTHSLADLAAALREGLDAFYRDASPLRGRHNEDATNDATNASFA